MKKLNAAFAFIFMLVLAPIMSMAQVVINPGGGGSGTTTLTAASTPTSGCTDGAFLYSLSSLLNCGAVLTTDGSTVTVNNGAAAASIFVAKDNGTAVFTIADGGNVTMNSTSLNGFAAINMGTSSYIGDPSGVLGGYTNRTGLTPDGMILYTGTTPNSVHVTEFGDINFDFQNACTTGLGTTACTDPTVIVQSHNQDTGEFLSMAHDGKAGVIAGGNSTVLDGLIRLGGTVTLTESSATTVLTIPIPVSTGSGGFINYVVDARDATNVQIRTGNVSFAVANNSGGTETCNVFGIGPTTQAVGGNTTNPANPTEVQDGSGTGAITSGTLTYAWSVDTTGTNSCVLKLNAVSSLTQTTLQVHYTVISTGPAIVTGG